MAENVFYLHGQPSPVGHFLRVGTTGHRQLETLLGAGKTMPDRVVIEASAAGRQQELIQSLREAGAELILDTNIAELSSLGRFSGAAREAPWANPSAVLSPDDMKANANRDVIGQIARFAVAQGFHAVLAPTHILEGSPDPLFGTDRDATAALRRSLDAEGGAKIDIHYELNIKNGSLRDPVQRRAFISGLTGTPCASVWFRVSGFGADATPMGLRRYIAAMLDFTRLDRPIVADGVGGLAAIAIAAFGAAGGICHGVAERERFDASDWAKPPKPGGGGRERRVLIGAVDRLLSVKQLETLMAAPGARKALSCHDRHCCPHGLEDMLKDPKAHYLRQRARQIADIARVPDSRRVRHFLDQELAPTERAARNAAKLKVADDSLVEMLTRSSERLEKMHGVLEDLGRTIDGAPRAASPERSRSARVTLSHVRR
ncbi:hypothetical protein [Aureimonas leprariae]|uniref:Uncharacterized protein n=1 Tax=Plantimonas leprariae TaxID=2615207 RepID=A0A7V7TUH3_9HYPH|nr:hypothetical protein [Aureimonas leprariae]KAB0676020.1 hypothetical protein F6X38_22425 [Aureimonas leprariae]